MSVACVLALLLAAPAAGVVAPETGAVTPGPAPGGSGATVEAGSGVGREGPGSAAPVGTGAVTPAFEPGREGPGSAAPVGTGAVTPAFEPGLANEVHRLRAAAELRAAGRFAEAAAIYEALYDGRHAPELLLAAARTRGAAGQYAHVLVYLSHLVASGQLTAADTQVVYGELQAAQGAVTPVTVRAQMPARAGEALLRLRAEFLAQSPGEQRPPLEFLVPAGVGATRAATVQLDLRLPADGLPQPQRRRLVGALVGLGGVTLAAGAGVTAAWELTRVRPALGSSCDELSGCDATLAAAVTGRGVGGALIGAGSGVLLAGLTGLFDDPRRRRGAWIFELVLGGAGVAGGSFATALAARGFEREVAADAPWGDANHMRALELRARQHTFAAAGLGLGSGLVFGAAAGLVRSRIYQQRQRNSLALAPTIGRGGFGLTLAGRF